MKNIFAIHASRRRCLRSYLQAGIGAAILAVVVVACRHSEGAAQLGASSTSSGHTTNETVAMVETTELGGATRPCSLELQADRAFLEGGLSVHFPGGVEPDSQYVEGGQKPPIDSVAVSASARPLVQAAVVPTCDLKHPTAKITWAFRHRIGAEVDSSAHPLEQSLATCFSGNSNFPGPYQRTVKKDYWQQLSHNLASDNTYCTAEFRWRPQPEQIGDFWFSGPEFKPGEDYWFREAVIFRGKMGIDGLLHGYTLRYIVPESDWPHVSETIWSSLKSMEIDWEKFGMPTQPPNRKELRLRKGR